jgi:hypothetical protein
MKAEQRDRRYSAALFTKALCIAAIATRQALQQ